jgi:D-glycero-D-manno-heptose 1,7-bisphosphate phosphatase
VLAVSNKSCLFLDRDGVINKKLDNDYVKQWNEFTFIDGAIEALQILCSYFKTIVIVTNQQGIGKGLYSESDLNEIHSNMLKAFFDNNINIDAVFYAPNLSSEKSIMRKPTIGMALKAKALFKNILLEESFIVGDSISDMEFGKNAGMKTIFINKKKTENYNHNVIDNTFESLLHFANSFRSNEH